MVFDIDHFKRINDSHGHAVGDKVIVALADDLQRAFGSAGHVARVGGEEFVVHVASVSLEHAVSLANMLRISFSDREWPELGIAKGITVSCGLSSVVFEDRALEHAFLRADDALYAAKSAGRNTVVVREALMAAPLGERQPLRLAS